METEKEWNKKLYVAVYDSGIKEASDILDMIKARYDEISKGHIRATEHINKKGR